MNAQVQGAGYERFWMRLGRMEVISDCTVPMPLSICISRMLGVPMVMHVSSSNGLGNTSRPYLPTAGRRSPKDLTAYQAGPPLRLLELDDPGRLEEGPREGPDLLLQANDQGERPSRVWTATSLQLKWPGHEGDTTQLIGPWQAARLLPHPDQMQKLHDDPYDRHGCGGRCCTYDSPNTQWTSRDCPQAVCPACFFRRTFEERCLLARPTAAIEAVIPAPVLSSDRFDVTRAENRHVAFGSGLYFCLERYFDPGNGRP